MRPYCIVLKYYTDISLFCGDIDAFLCIKQHTIPYGDGSGFRFIQTEQSTDQCSLPASAWPDKADDFSALNFQ